MIQKQLAFVPVRRASEGAQHPAVVEPKPPLTRKRESDSLLATPPSKRFAVPRRTNATGDAEEAPIPSDLERTLEPTTKANSDARKQAANLSSFLQWDTCCPQGQMADARRRQVNGKLFAFGSADNGADQLLTGQSSHSAAEESVWQSGVRMLSSFGGPNRSHGPLAPPVMSINPDGTLAVVFQQGGRSMMQMARETLYDRTAVSDLHYITCTNQIQDVSWSARSPNKIVVCSSTSSDVELWNASEARREAVLSGQTSFTTGLSSHQGFLTIYAFKDTQHMLAAGGYGPGVQLWDARACTQASMSLPLMRDDIVTSLLCSPSCHRIIAGTSSGMLVSWDMRKIVPTSVHVFGSKGPTQAHPSRVSHLPTLAATWPSVLPYNAQLRLCTGVLASVGELQSAPPQPVQSAAGVAAANSVRSEVGLGDNSASRGVATFRLGLSRSSTFATKALGSKVNHLVADPTDPHRVAFSLSCGSAGVMHLDDSVVTHVFNPYTYQPCLRPIDMRTSRCNPRDIAWSSDGNVLYHTLPQRHLRGWPQEDDVLLPSCTAQAHSHMHARNHTGSISEHAGGAWEDFSGPGDDMPVRRLICALDATSHSALRCIGDNSNGSKTTVKANSSAPFCMEYRVQLPSIDDMSCMHGADGAEDSDREGAGAATCTTSQLHARFATLGSSDRSGHGGGALGEGGGGLASMPGDIDSGVTFSRAGAEEGCTLLYDRFERNLLMCGPTELKGMPV